jgi:small GTP-binding protein
MKNQNEKKNFSIVLLGDADVPKTHILNCYKNDKIKTDETNGSMIGIDDSEKHIEIDNIPIELQLIDTAGQEKFKAVTQSIYPKGDGFIIFFNYSNNESFDSITYWYNNIIEFSKFKKIPPPTLIVGIFNNDDNINKEKNLDIIKEKIKETNKEIKSYNIIGLIDCNYTKLEDIKKIFETIVNHLLKYSKEREHNNTLNTNKNKIQKKKSCFGK